MNIAILGYGTVGSGVKEIIDHAVTKSIKQLHVSYILIRKGKAKTLPYMCDDIHDFTGYFCGCHRGNDGWS